MGVQKGIERSAKILMPLLFLILIVLSVHSLLMPGGEAGLKFLFAPEYRAAYPSLMRWFNTCVNQVAVRCVDEV